jgi:hypothetical protein
MTEATGRLTLEGSSILEGGAVICLSGFGNFDRNYLITLARHWLSRESAYKTGWSLALHIQSLEARCSRPRERTASRAGRMFLAFPLPLFASLLSAGLATVAAGQTSFTPAKDYTGIGAGHQFRNDINNHLGGGTPIAPQLLQLYYSQLPIEADRQMCWCKDCEWTNPCLRCGGGSLAIGALGVWDRSLGGSGGSKLTAATHYSTVQGADSSGSPRSIAEATLNQLAAPTASLGMNSKQFTSLANALAARNAIVYAHTGSALHDLRPNINTDSIHFFGAMPGVQFSVDQHNSGDPFFGADATDTGDSDLAISRAVAASPSGGPRNIYAPRVKLSGATYKINEPILVIASDGSASGGSFQINFDGDSDFETEIVNNQIGGPAIVAISAKAITIANNSSPVVHTALVTGGSSSAWGEASTTGIGYGREIEIDNLSIPGGTTGLSSEAAIPKAHDIALAQQSYVGIVTTGASCSNALWNIDTGLSDGNSLVLSPVVIGRSISSVRNLNVFSASSYFGPSIGGASLGDSYLSTGSNQIGGIVCDGQCVLDNDSEDSEARGNLPGLLAPADLVQSTSDFNIKDTTIEQHGTGLPPVKVGCANSMHLVFDHVPFAVQNDGLTTEADFTECGTNGGWPVSFIDPDFGGQGGVLPSGVTFVNNGMLFDVTASNARFLPLFSRDAAGADTDYGSRGARFT